MLADADPRFRELAVRILGRDCRENGHVEFKNAAAQEPAAALAHLDKLLPLAADPDAGVRRELILAIRNLPTDKVGDALRKLVAGWDGHDRWYLEALGLALDKRESDYLSTLFDGTLFGELDLGSRRATTSTVARPTVFPGRPQRGVHREGHARPAGERREQVPRAWPGGFIGARCLPVLERIVPQLRAPELQQAADDMLERMNEPETARAGRRHWRLRPTTRSTSASCWRCWRAASRAHGTAGTCSAEGGFKAIDRTLEDPAIAPAGDGAGGRDGGRPLPREPRVAGRRCQAARGSPGRGDRGAGLLQGDAQPGARPADRFGTRPAELECARRGRRAGRRQAP